MRARNNTLELLGKGLYSPPEVARLVGISASRVRRWVRGYGFVYSTIAGRRRGTSPPVVSAELPRIDRYRAVSFLELVEVLVVRALLDRGVSLRNVRRAHRRAAGKLDTLHPFAFEKFKTDGRGIFLELARESDDYRPLLEMASGQYALPKALNRYLHQIDFGMDTLMATRWWPLGRSRPVVLDPAIAFGTPVIAGTRVPVQSVLDALRAGETKNSVCKWFGVRSRDVSAAVSFGRRGEAA
jgi:uncharacterized protein (DUF433 family)